MKTRKAMMALAIAITVGAVGACSSGGGSNSSPAATVSPEEGVHFLTDYVVARQEGASKSAEWHRTLDELLPNVQYRKPDGTAQPLTELAVLGRVTDVRKGRGFVVVGEDAPSGTPVPFDTPGARWWSLEATVAVEKALGSTDVPQEVRFALTVQSPKDFDQLAAGLKGLGRVVLFLYKHPMWNYDDSLYSIFGETYVATVAADGTLALPFIVAEDAAKNERLLARTRRLAELEARASQPRQTIQMIGEPGLEQRADGA